MASYILTGKECEQVAEILNRRANEIAGFKGDYMTSKDPYRSVELALTREIERLRRLADKINPKGEDE